MENNNIENNNKKKIIIKKKSEQANSNINEKNESLNMESNQESNSNPEQNNEDFAKMFEESISEKEIQSNEIVTGKVVEIREEDVFVDVGYKSEGLVPKTDFEEEPQIGQDVDVYIVAKENNNGELVLSKKRADTIKAKRNIENSYKNQTTIKGRVEREIKGGFIVRISGNMEAFVPISQMDITRINNYKDYLDKTYDFKVIEYDRKPKQANIVLSRRQLLEEKLQKEKEEFFSKLNVGDKVEGTIKNIKQYGIFVNLGPIDGFVHIKDLSWGHIRQPEDLFKVGDKVKAKVLDFNKENEKISLSIKQLTEDPWNVFIKEYKKGDTVKGEVTKLSDYGAFVKIFEGVEGLLHISEMSWTKRINHPKDILKKGDIIQTKILDIEQDDKKLSLGLKQIMPNPWDNIDEILSEGKKVTGKVKNIIKNGLNCRIAMASV
ncbi:MAG: 30S ribosomal protein S1, partial [bacterium]